MPGDIKSNESELVQFRTDLLFTAILFAKQRITFICTLSSVNVFHQFMLLIDKSANTIHFPINLQLLKYFLTNTAFFERIHQLNLEKSCFLKKNSPKSQVLSSFTKWLVYNSFPKKNRSFPYKANSDMKFVLSVEDT